MLNLALTGRERPGLRLWPSGRTGPDKRMCRLQRRGRRPRRSVEHRAWARGPGCCVWVAECVQVRLLRCMSCALCRQARVEPSGPAVYARGACSRGVPAPGAAGGVLGTCSRGGSIPGAEDCAFNTRGVQRGGGSRGRARVECGGQGDASDVPEGLRLPGSEPWLMCSW